MGRTFGFGADRVTGMDVVTCDGMCASRRRPRQTCSGRFGAGRAGVGIVTSVDVGLVPCGRCTAASSRPTPTWPTSRCGRGWTGCRACRRTTSSVALLQLPDCPSPAGDRGRFVVHVRVAHIGEDASGEAVIRVTRDRQPPLGTIGRMPYGDQDHPQRSPRSVADQLTASRQLQEFPADAATRRCWPTAGQPRTRR